MATTATAPAGRTHYGQPLTADRVLDGDTQTVAVNLEPVAASLIRDMVRAPIARACFAELLLAASDDPARLMDTEYVQLADELVRRLSQVGALTITLDQHQALELAEQLDSAVVDANTCPACGRLHDHPLGGRCVTCEEGRR